MSLPPHIDNTTLIDLIMEEGVESISLLQESTTGIRAKFDSRGSADYEKFNEWGTGFYFLHGNRDAFYSTNEFDRSYTDLLRIADQLLETEGKLQANEYSGPTKPVDISILDQSPISHQMEEEITEYQQTITQELDGHDAFHYNIQIEAEISSRTHQSSYNAEIKQTQGSLFITIELFDKLGGNEVYVYTDIGGLTQEDVTPDILTTQVRNLIETYHQVEVAKSVKPKKYDLVLGSDTSFSLIHESIGHGVEADQVLTGDSFLWKSIGKKVASPLLTVIDDPHIREFGWSEFDDEGIKTKGTLLVENGILVDFLHTRKTARLLDSEITGNARATSYISPPEPRQSNLYIEPGDYETEELMEEINNGLLIGPTTSATTSIYSGDFIIEAQYGFLIENGEKKDLVKSPAIVGNSIDTLQRVTAIGDNVERIASFCVKDDSRLKLGAVSPSIIVEDTYVN